MDAKEGICAGTEAGLTWFGELCKGWYNWGRGGRKKARAQVTLNKIMITSDFHLTRISQGLDGN